MINDEKEYMSSNHLEGGIAVVERDTSEEELSSDCCSALPFGESFIEEDMTGICSSCYDGANFTYLSYLDSEIETHK